LIKVLIQAFMVVLKLKQSQGFIMSKQTKHDMIMTSLQSPDGATLEALIEATGWQSHSVRGYLSSLRKKGHEINSILDHNGDRVYNINQPKET
jgi:hypothetical protein